MRSLSFAVVVCSVVGVACDGELGREARLQLLVAGKGRLVGFGDRACSRGQGGSHRHCAFFRPAPDAEMQTELWVIDVTRALAGESIACDGTSSGCLRMTDHLFTGTKFESPAHPEAHRFDGDTLLFLADPGPNITKLDRYEGHVWAWRPGWRRPRALTTEGAVLCNASESAPVAYCVDGVTETGRIEFDLRVGRLRDQDDSLLPVVERIVPRRGDDVVWSAGFSADGSQLVYSSWRDTDRAQTLRVGPVDRPDATQAVVEGGRFWTVASDGRAVYFLRGGSFDKPAQLWSADFPSGGNVTMLTDGVFDFEVLGGSRGVAFRTDLKGFEGILHRIRDRARTQVAIDAHAWYPSEDGRFTYILQVDRRAERGLIADNDGGTICTLDSGGGETVYSPSFLPSLRSVVWSEPDENDLDVTYLARPDDCGGVRRLATGVRYLRPMGRGLVYAAELGEEPPSLFHLPVVGDGPLPAPGPAIMDHVDTNNVAPVGDAGLIIGSRDDAPGGAGLFLFGPL